MPDMLRHEESLYSGGFEIVGGVDEAGRGPLAGPVCAAAVVFGRGVFIEGIDDSKKLSESKRGIYAPIIKQTAIAYSIAMADASTIDTINILQATLLAMKNAVLALPVKPDALIIDGTFAPRLEGTRCVCLPKGDSLSFSVAAASILAKTERDAYMERLHAKYPEYLFNVHKGYGTREHINLIKLHGLSPQHRKSFRIKNLQSGQVTPE